METSPPSPFESPGTGKDKERGPRPPTPAERGQFADSRREEVPRPPIRPPLEGVVTRNEGVIQIRQPQEAAHSQPPEAITLHMQQQFEDAAEGSKDTKNESAVSRPADSVASVKQQVGQATERPGSTQYGELPLVEQAEPPAKPADDIQRTWYYTPQSQTPGQAGAGTGEVDQRSAALRAFEATLNGGPQPMTPGEVTPLGDGSVPEVAQPIDQEPEPAAWRYNSEQQAANTTTTNTYEQPVPSYVTSENTEYDTQPVAPNPWFAARTQQQPPIHRQQAASGAPSASGGGSGPNNPNVPPTPGGPGGPNTPPNPFNASYNQYPSVAVNSMPATPMERLSRTERHSHRGLVLGIVGGLLVEHILAKRRDNKLSERIDTLQKENAQAQKQANAANQELQRSQQTFRTEQQRAQQEVDQLRKMYEAPAYVAPVESRADVSGPASYAAANLAPVARPEQRAVSAHQTAEQQPVAGSSQQESIDQQGGPVRLRPGEHIKRSEWHSYVEKDGRIVEDAINYGQGFQQEQQQERGHVATYDNVQAGTVQGQPYNPAGGYGTTAGLPSGMTTQGLPPGQPTHADAQHQLPEHTRSGTQVVSNFTNPWFWLMLALIFAAFFITITV